MLGFLCKIYFLSFCSAFSTIIIVFIIVPIVLFTLLLMFAVMHAEVLCLCRQKVCCYHLPSFLTVRVPTLQCVALISPGFQAPSLPVAKLTLNKLNKHNSRLQDVSLRVHGYLFCYSVCVILSFLHPQKLQVSLSLSNLSRLEHNVRNEENWK